MVTETIGSETLLAPSTAATVKQYGPYKLITSTDMHAVAYALYKNGIMPSSVLGFVWDGTNYVVLCSKGTSA